MTANESIARPNLTAAPIGHKCRFIRPACGQRVGAAIDGGAAIGGICVCGRGFTGARGAGAVDEPGAAACVPAGAAVNCASSGA